MKVVIVGGVAGGATTAARLRRLREDAEIILFERDEHISFANCGLPYYIGGVIKDRDALLVQTPQEFKSRYNVDVRILSEVVSIDRALKTVTIHDKKTDQTYVENYDKLLLSPGARPIRPPIKGLAEAENVFTLRNIPDTDAIKRFVEEKHPKTAVVVGGGFIGIEMAENLTELGLEVILVEKLPQVMRNLDYEMAQIVHRELNAKGVSLALSDGIHRFEKEGKEVVLESGRVLSADLVILAIGVAPESSLARSAELALNASSHIKTDEFLRVLDVNTGEADPSVYAVGDAIEIEEVITGHPSAIPLAGTASRQAWVAAGHMASDDNAEDKIPYKGALGASVAKVFSLTVACVGLNSAQLKDRNIPFIAIHAHRANHTSYYPDSKNISFKLLFSPETGKIFGAQAVGADGVEKRIDVISAAISLGGTVRNLTELELCYAPPFSAPKDPVNILGYIASNYLDGAYKYVHYNEIDSIVQDGGYLLDVRTPAECQLEPIQGAKNIPVDELRDRLSELPEDLETPIYATCRVGLRAHIALMILKGRGYKNLYNLSGGYLTYNWAKFKAGDCERPLLRGQQITAVIPKHDTDTQRDITIEQVEEKGIETAIEVDARGLACPGPLMATYKALSQAADGDVFKILSSDSGFVTDVKSYCQANNHELISVEQVGEDYVAYVRKGMGGKAAMTKPAAGLAKENATIVVFSGALDKALAAMIIAQGAVAGGKAVTLFFTFWGLNILRKPTKEHVKKNLVEKMFGRMMPRGAKKLPLSNMNMMGMGSKMIKGIMKKHSVDDIETMIKNVMDAGVRFIACTMSMELMGIKKEELIEGVELGGVATYISSNENASTTLFI